MKECEECNHVAITEDIFKCSSCNKRFVLVSKDDIPELREIKNDEFD